MTGRTSPDPERDRRGQYRRSLKTAERDAKAAGLRGEGWSLQRIADELGYPSRGAVHEGIDRAFKNIPTEDVAAAKRLDLERIDRLIEQAWLIVERRHLMVSHGRVVTRQVGFERDAYGEIVYDAAGKPVKVLEEVTDPAPVLAAIDRIRALLERRAKMLGYDEPTRARIEVITQDVIEAEIARLEAQLARA